jgi:hypothetical protein
MEVMAENHLSRKRARTLGFKGWWWWQRITSLENERVHSVSRKGDGGGGRE